MTKIPLTRSQELAMHGLVFSLAFIGTICLILVLATLYGCGAPRRPIQTVHPPHPLIVPKR